ncbi:MAG: four helix bundle protein [Ginsengibacter sp.]
MKIHNFKELLVWQKAMDIAVFTYQLTGFFPKEEKYGLISQMQRCSVSIPSNIAEGSGRVSNKEFQHFISIAMGSSFELETQVILAFRFNYITKEQLDEFGTMVTTIQKMSFGLYNSLNN